MTDEDQKKINNLHNAVRCMESYVEYMKKNLIGFPSKSVPLDQFWKDKIASGEAIAVDDF